MKQNIFSIIIFMIGIVSFLIAKQYYLDDLYFEHKDIKFIENIRSNDDIEQLRSLALTLLAFDELHVNSYNNLLKNSFNLVISLCFLAALFSVLAIISDNKNSKRNK